MNNSEFYNLLSNDYDEMINFENSLKNKMRSLENFILPDYKAALDLGCGTGIDSIALSKLGLKVDALDHSKKMLKKAAINSEKHKTKVNFIQSGLADLNLENKSYDFIVSLGNTIANIENKDLNKLLANLKEHLIKDGKIIIQLINYAKLPKSGDYFLNEYNDENISIIRKYDIHASFIKFIIQKKEKRTKKESQIATKLFPHHSTYFKAFAKKNGFKIELYGSLKQESYVESNSQNLVIVLSR